MLSLFKNLDSINLYLQFEWHSQIKIHRSCPGELDDVVKQLEEATGSVAVGQIGRTLIIYRPSPTKLKAEEKRKQIRQLFLKRQLKYRQVNKVIIIIIIIIIIILNEEAKQRYCDPFLIPMFPNILVKQQSKEPVPKLSRRGSSWKARSSRS